MAYLSNAAVNRLNLHTGMHMLAWNMSGNFFIAFMLSHGFTAVQTFLYIALILGLRFSLRPIILVLAPHLGSRLLLFIGICFFSIQYVLLARVDGVNTLFCVYCLCCALSDIFYWCSYHAMYAFTGDDPHRAKQIGAREALSTMTNIIAPLAGGLAIDHFGAMSAFAFAAALELLSIIPLFKVPNLPIAEKRPHGAFGAVWQAFFIFVTDGWISTGLNFVWAAMLFGSANDSFSTYGGALALAGFVSAVGGLFLGRLIDGGHANRAVVFNGILLIAALLLKASAGPQLGSMLGITAVSALLGASYIPVLMTAIYSLAARAPCPLRFIFAVEGAWDIGAGSACLITAGLLHLGMPLNPIIALAILGALMQMFLLHRYYRRRHR